MPKLHLEYWKNQHTNDEYHLNDKDVKDYIEQTSHGDYSSILKYDGRWSTFFHLSEMRESILNWYEFKKNSNLLEIGGGMGALTGLFCTRCTHVTSVEPSKLRAEALFSRYSNVENLDIFAGEIYDIKFEKKFDYITVVGELEGLQWGKEPKTSYIDFLRYLGSLLKPDGKLLIARDNRYGVKYWCGDREPVTGIPFEGINGYPNSVKPFSYGKKELERILISAGLNKYKFYYPLPDYKLPQMIYSEKQLPQSGLKSRLIPYYFDNKTLVASEMDLYDDLIENNVFEFFSNSFLVECGFDEDFCSVVYAATTTDRPLGYRFSTTIHQNNIVKKIPLDKSGQASVQNIYDNLMELQSRGLSIVPIEVNNNMLVMPRVSSMSLESYLKSIIRQDRDLFIEIFDKYYDCILKSSDFVDSNMNFFFDERNSEIEYGPILNKAYIDLIPNNCFFIENDFVFFDQEFAKINFPASFIMFRALKYTYSFISDADSLVPLKEMKLRYKLDKIWDIFEDEDMKFVSENRNYSVYRNFLNWSYIDKNNLHQNANILMKSAEAEALIRKGYRKIAIYGFGYMGMKLYKNLTGTAVDVVYAIDQNADNIQRDRYIEIPLIQPSDELEQVDAIVISIPSAFNSIQSLLKKKISCPIISVEDITIKNIL